MNIYYSQTAKTFSFDQIFYLDAAGQFEIITYSGGDNIAVDNNGYFHGYYESSYVGHYPEEVGVAPERHDLDSGRYEVFRGVMNPAGDIGTGLAYYGDADADPNVGTRFYTSYETFDPPSVAEAPDSVIVSELAGWKTYLSSPGVLSLDVDDLGAWQVFYKLDSQSAPRSFSWDDVGGTYEINTFLSAFTTNPNGDDLSTWGGVSLLVASMP